MKLRWEFFFYMFEVAGFTMVLCAFVVVPWWVGAVVGGLGWLGRVTSR